MLCCARRRRHHRFVVGDLRADRPNVGGRGDVFGDVAAGVVAYMGTPRAQPPDPVAALVPSPRPVGAAGPGSLRLFDLCGDGGFVGHVELAAVGDSDRDHHTSVHSDDLISRRRLDRIVDV